MEKNLEDQTLYLMFKGANRHLLDFEEKDCCDKAKENGLAKVIHEFVDCIINKKFIPKGRTSNNYLFKDYYQRQEDENLKRLEKINR